MLAFIQLNSPKQPFKAIFSLLALAMLLTSTIFSLSAFTLAPSSPSLPRNENQQLIPHKSGCFPSGVLWTWTDQGHNPPLQAWISQMEFNSTYGWHYNFHVQHLCGNDIHNYHIYYVPGDPNYYIWEVYDSTTNTTKDYKYERLCGCGGSFPPIAAESTAPIFANDAANAVGDSYLYNASVSFITDAFLAVAEKSGDH